MFESKLARIVVIVIVVAAAAFGGKFYLAAQAERDACRSAVSAARSSLLEKDGPMAAMRAAVTGLESFPDEPELHLLRAIGLIARNRTKDAEDALQEALRLSPEPSLRAEIDFHLARTRVLRYLDVGDRGDLNQAEPQLEALRSDLRFTASAELLLGLARAKVGKDLPAAKALLRSGLEGTLASGAEGDAARARTVFETL